MEHINKSNMQLVASCIFYKSSGTAMFIDYRNYYSQNTLR